MYSSIQALWSTGSIGATTTFKVSPSWNVRGIVENTVYLKVYEDACSGTAATGYWTFDQSSCTFTAVNMKPKFASQTWINGSGETSEGALVHANTQNTCKRQYPKGATKKNTFYTISGVTGSCNNPMQDGDVAVSPNPVGGGQYSCNDPLVYVDLKTDDNALYPQIVEDWCPICTKRKAGTNDHVDNYVDNDSCTAKSWPNYWEADLGQGAEELRVSVGNQFAAQTGAATVTKSAKFLKYEDGDVKVTAKNVNDKIVLALDTSTLHKDIELPSEASEVNAIRRYRNQLAVITRMGGLASRVFIIDVTQGAVTDTFDGFDPSPDGRLIAFVKFYPPHFVQGPDDHYMLYDVNKTAVKNRPMGVPLDDSIDVGVNVYPGAGNKEDDNVGVPGKLQHHSASPFFWSADSAKLVFADQGQVLSIVMVKINESDAGEPATLVSALNGTSVCAAPLSVNSHCEAYMDNVEFVDQSIKSYFSGLGTKGSIQRELLVAEKDFRSNRK